MTSRGFAHRPRPCARVHEINGSAPAFRIVRDGRAPSDRPSSGPVDRPSNGSFTPSRRRCRPQRRAPSRRLTSSSSGITVSTRRSPHRLHEAASGRRAASSWRRPLRSSARCRRSSARCPHRGCERASTRSGTTPTILRDLLNALGHQRATFVGQSLPARATARSSVGERLPQDDAVVSPRITSTAKYRPSCR